MLVRVNVEPNRNEGEWTLFNCVCVCVFERVREKTASDGGNEASENGGMGTWQRRL